MYHKWEPKRLLTLRPKQIINFPSFIYPSKQLFSFTFLTNHQSIFIKTSRHVVINSVLYNFL